MSYMKRAKRIALLALPAFLLTACVEYTIETTVNPDGSGARVEVMEAEENGDVNVSPESFSKVMHVTAEEGWSHDEAVDSDGDTIQIFRRRTRVSDLPGWSALSGRVRISGAVPEKAASRIGYVSYGSVLFRNEVRVHRAADSDGHISFRYRETFTWDRAADALVEFLMADLDTRLAEGYPGFPPMARGEIVGFARARLWMAVDEGLLSGDGEEDDLMREVIRTTADHFENMYPDEDQDTFLQLLTLSLEENDDRLVPFLEEDFPGVNVALNSEIVFRLNMPGRITDSNAHRREDGVLVWKFGPGDAFYGPIEIVAESEMGG